MAAKRDRESWLIGIRGVGLIQRLPKTRTFGSCPRTSRSCAACFPWRCGVIRDGSSGLRHRDWLSGCCEQCGAGDDFAALRCQAPANHDMRLACLDLADLASRQTTQQEWRAARDGVPDCSDTSGAVERGLYEFGPGMAICCRKLRGGIPEIS
jgi:hypothetical protein